MMYLGWFCHPFMVGNQWAPLIWKQVYELWEIILLMISSLPLSLFLLTLDLPLYRNWTSWTLFKKPFIALYYFHLSVSLLYFLGDFLTTLSSKLLSISVFNFQEFFFFLIALRIFLLNTASCPCFIVAVSSVSEDINKVYFWVFFFFAVVYFGLYLIKGFPQKSDNP